MNKNQNNFGAFATVGRLAADFFMGGLLFTFRALGFALDKVLLGYSFLWIPPAFSCELSSTWYFIAAHLAYNGYMTRPLQVAVWQRYFVPEQDSWIS